MHPAHDITAATDKKFGNAPCACLATPPLPPPALPGQRPAQRAASRRRCWRPRQGTPHRALAATTRPMFLESRNHACKTPAQTLPLLCITRPSALCPLETALQSMRWARHLYAMRRNIACDAGDSRQCVNCMRLALLHRSCISVTSVPEQRRWRLWCQAASASSLLATRAAALRRPPHCAPASTLHSAARPRKQR